MVLGAGGKITARQCNVNHQDQIWKDYVKKELETGKMWERKWGFLPGKYQEMRKTAAEAGLITSRSSIGSSMASQPLKLPPLHPPKQDTVRPFPQVTSRVVGWRSGKEHALEVFGRWGRPRHFITHQLKWPDDAVP